MVLHSAGLCTLQEVVAIEGIHPMVAVHHVLQSDGAAPDRSKLREAARMLSFNNACNSTAIAPLGKADGDWRTGTVGLR